MGRIRGIGTNEVINRTWPMTLILKGAKRIKAIKAVRKRKAGEAPAERPEAEQSEEGQGEMKEDKT
jgi:hypothetical protein